jgi:hypothetical protein
LKNFDGFPTCAFPAKEGFVSFALRGIATRLALQRDAVAALTPNGLANIEKKKNFKRNWRVLKES